VLPGVLHYATDPDYLACMESNLRATLAQAPRATVVFSAHGLPVKQIEAGDPYEREIHRTIGALEAGLGAIPGGYRLAYQSQVGPIRWLSPALETVLKELAGKDVVIVPVSFVGEHIETLHELDIHYREMAEKLGVKRYLRVPAPGTHPDFVRCLVGLTLTALARCESGKNSRGVGGSAPE